MNPKLPTPPFQCSTCNRIHYELPDVGYREPVYYFGVPEDERTKRAQLGSDLCVIDDEYFFVRGVMHFPIRGTPETLGWGVWSSLSKTNFERYRAHYDEDLSGWDPMFGYLSNMLPGFPDTLSLKLSVQTQQKGQRPLFLLHDGDHPLVSAQREGITVEKWWEIVGPVLHGPRQDQ